MMRALLLALVLGCGKAKPGESDAGLATGLKFNNRDLVRPNLYSAAFYSDDVSTLFLRVPCDGSRCEVWQDGGMVFDDSPTCRALQAVYPCSARIGGDR